MATTVASTQHPERRENGQVRFGRTQVLDAQPAGDEGSPRRSELRQERIDEGGLSDAWISRDEDELPLLVESRLERLHQNVHLGLATHQVGGSGARRDGLGGTGYRLGPLRLDRMEEAIAAPDDGLDDALPDGAPHIADVRAENAVAHYDLPPYYVDELLLGHQALRMLCQILQDR